MPCRNDETLTWDEQDIRDTIEFNLGMIRDVDLRPILRTITGTILGHMGSDLRVSNARACLDELLEDLNRCGLDPTLDRFGVRD